MKKIFPLLAVAMMAFCTTSLLSCGSDDNSVASEKVEITTTTTLTDWSEGTDEERTAIRNAELKALAELLSSKMGSLGTATIANVSGLNQVAITPASGVTADQLKAALSVVNQEAVAEKINSSKIAGITYFTFYVYINGSAVIKVEYDNPAVYLTSMPTGTWKSADSSIDLTIKMTDAVVRINDYDNCQATITYNGNPYSAYAFPTGSYFVNNGKIYFYWSHINEINCRTTDTVAEGNDTPKVGISIKFEKGSSDTTSPTAIVWDNMTNKDFKVALTKVE